MIRKFHGVDLHKRYATILVRNEKGEEVAFFGKVRELPGSRSDPWCGGCGDPGGYQWRVPLGGAHREAGERSA